MQNSLFSIRNILIFVFSFGLMLTNVWADSISTPRQLYFPTFNTVGGNPQGKVTVVEFFDYNCEYCHEMPTIFKKVVKSNPDVRIVYRDYPVLGSSSLHAARAALAASQQGKYLAFHDALFATREPITQATISRVAKDVGVDSQKFMEQLGGKSISQQLSSNDNVAQSLGLQGVPVVIVAATPSKDQKTVKAYVLTSPSYSELQEAINKAGATG